MNLDSVCLMLVADEDSRTFRLDLRSGAFGQGHVLHTVVIDTWAWSAHTAVHVFTLMARSMYTEVYYHSSLIPYMR